MSSAEVVREESIRAVLFDVGGTLIEVAPSVGSVYAAVCARRGFPVEATAVQRAFDAAWTDLSAEIPRGADRYRVFAGGEREWWRRVSGMAFDTVGVPRERQPTESELRAFFARPEAWNVFPDARGALDALASRGYRLAVVSNWDSRLPALLSALGLEDYFEAVLYSADVGYEKPHPEIFNKALEALELPASRAVHIGDRLEEDYAAARALGLRALLLDRNPGRAGLREEMTRWGTPEDLVGDLDEAVERISE